MYLSANTKVMKKQFLNIYCMFIFSVRIINVKLNKLPIMEIMTD